MTHQLSCSTACGIFLDQVLNPSHLHWPVNSLPLSYQGILSHFFLVEIYHVYRFNRDPDDGDLQMMVLYIYTHTHTHTHTYMKVKVQLISCVQLCDPWTVAHQGSSVQWILKARILEWVAIPFSRGSSWLRDRTWISHIVGRFFTIWATSEAYVPTHTHIIYPGKCVSYVSIY